MRDSELNKCCGIGPGGIKCGCCVDIDGRSSKIKKYYRRMKRKLLKILTRKEINEAFD